MTRTLREKLLSGGTDWNPLAREVCVPGTQGVAALDSYCWPRREPAIACFSGSVFTVPERRLAFDSAWMKLRIEVASGHGMFIENARDYEAADDKRILSEMRRELALYASRIPAEEMLIRCIRAVIGTSPATRAVSDRILFDEAGFQRLQRLPAPERAVLNAALWVGLSPWRIAELGFGNVGVTVDAVAKVYASGRAMIA